MEWHFSLPQHPEQKGKAEIRLRCVKPSSCLSMDKCDGRMLVWRKEVSMCSLMLCLHVLNPNALNQFVPQQIWDSAGGRGFWVRIAQLLSCWCFWTLSPEDDPSQCKCTSPQSLPHSRMPCPHFLSSALWMWRFLRSVVTFLWSAWCTSGKRPDKWSINQSLTWEKYILFTT